MAVILMKGDAHTPTRFWARAVCLGHEFTEQMKDCGWVKTDSRQYLSGEQLAYLDKHQSQ